METTNSRPAGITTLAVLGGIGALIFPFAPAPIGAGGDPVVGLIGMVLTAVYAFGLFSLKPWARYLGIANFGLGALLLLAASQILPALIQAWIAYYLIANPDVRKAFAGGKPVEKPEVAAPTGTTPAES